MFVLQEVKPKCPRYEYCHLVHLESGAKVDRLPLYTHAIDCESVSAVNQCDKNSLKRQTFFFLL